ncbi:DUF6228 family protein [Streptomyces hundungensis]|uniref:DUF6228 family protein n=1 Tax=Streptomyces hundungensis TaxID=1077946 RepID=UPI00319DEADD
MSSHDAYLGTASAVTVRCQNNRSVSVRLCDSFRPDEDRVQYAIEASAPRLTMRVDEVVAWNWGPTWRPSWRDWLPTSAAGTGSGSGRPTTGIPRSARSSAPADTSG